MELFRKPFRVSLLIFSRELCTLYTYFVIVFLHPSTIQNKVPIRRLNTRFLDEVERPREPACRTIKSAFPEDGNFSTFPRRFSSNFPRVFTDFARFRCGTIRLTCSVSTLIKPEAIVRYLKMTSMKLSCRLNTDRFQEH